MKLERLKFLPCRYTCARPRIHESFLKRNLMKSLFGQWRFARYLAKSTWLWSLFDPPRQDFEQRFPPSLVVRNAAISACAVDEGWQHALALLESCCRRELLGVQWPTVFIFPNFHLLIWVFCHWLVLMGIDFTAGNFFFQAA